MMTAQFTKAMVSQAIQTEDTVTKSNGKKTVYEKIDNSIRYRLIEMVFNYTEGTI